MSTLKNKVQLIGNVGNEPEITNLDSEVVVDEILLLGIKGDNATE